MTKKWYYEFFITILLICILTGCGQNNSNKAITHSSNSLASVLGVDLSQVDNVKISSGSASFSRHLTNRTEVQEFLKIFDGVEYTEGKLLQSTAVGFILDARLYGGDKEVASFTFGGDNIRVGNRKDNTKTYYHSSKNIDDKQIDAIVEKYKLSQKNEP